MVISLSRRSVIAGLTASLLAAPARAAELTPQEVLSHWYSLVLHLVRHTPTCSPPVASRAFAYFGVTVYEALASGNRGLRSMAGQLTALTPLPARTAGAAYDDAVVFNAAITDAAQNFFSNTGPSGQHALAAMESRMRDQVLAGVAPDVAQRSIDFGKAVADHILAWSQTDGGAVVTNLGFPDHYDLTPGPAHWVPTSPINLQQTPLLPNWGKNRPFAMPSDSACGLPPPPAYSEDPSSEFYKQGKEVCDTRNTLTPEQRAMLSPTPAGHWVSILLQISARDHLKAERLADVLMRVGVSVADGFIGCWQSKFTYDLVRPITYIRRTMDPKWEPLLITPPFPEYPSGHSTQSGAAAIVLTKFFGDNFAFDDATHIRDNIPARHVPSFWAAAQEAAISRLYGGIHFRAAIERGLDQGRCIGAFTNALQTVA
jgi:hypothetical protein